MFSINNITHPTSTTTVNAAFNEKNAEINAHSSSASPSASRLSIQNLLSPDLEETHLVSCAERVDDPILEDKQFQEEEEELNSPLWSQSCPSFFSSPISAGRAILTDSSSPDEAIFPSSFTSPLANSPSPTAQSPKLSTSRQAGNNPRAMSKRRRANSTQLATLNAVFKHTFFPSTDLRERLGKELNMSPRSVQIWFQNKRQQWRQRRKSEEQTLQQRQQHFSLHSQLFLHPQQIHQSLPVIHPESNSAATTTTCGNVRIAAAAAQRRGFEPVYSSIHHRLVPHPSSLPPAFVNPLPASSGIVLAPVATTAFHDQLSEHTSSPFQLSMASATMNNPYYYARHDQNP